MSIVPTVPFGAVPTSSFRWQEERVVQGAGRGRGGLQPATVPVSQRAAMPATQLATYTSQQPRQPSSQPGSQPTHMSPDGFSFPLYKAHCALAWGCGLFACFKDGHLVVQLHNHQHNCRCIVL